eukprot:15443853-Alexandrium_andersonii.AAC.1
MAWGSVVPCIFPLMSRVARESASSFQGCPMWLLMCANVVGTARPASTVAFAMSAAAIPGCAPGLARACATSSAYLESVVHEIFVEGCMDSACTCAACHARSSARLLVGLPSPSNPVSWWSMHPPSHPMKLNLGPPAPLD